MQGNSFFRLSAAKQESLRLDRPVTSMTSVSYAASDTREHMPRALVFLQGVFKKYNQSSSSQFFTSSLAEGRIFLALSAFWMLVLRPRRPSGILGSGPRLLVLMSF